ncbi:hypothetical protein DL93DRAFT_1211267 [Clavulina sp. PMI_390]|nr:hypothetical protein DL93DRAFT_1211267 [Clavulina sp. PMI_390]
MESSYSYAHLTDKLPDELLAEIFEHYVHVSPFTLHTLPIAGMQQLHSLLTLTSVSSRWRNAAIGASILWKWIVIAAHVVDRGADIGRSIIEAFLIRSRNRPISIFLSPPLDNFTNHEVFMQVYELVIPHLWRCDGFGCNQLGNAITPLLFPLIGPMPRLNALVLLGDTTIFDLSPITVFTEPSSLGALRSVMIIGVPIAPILDNSIDFLSINLKNTSPTWVMPLIASSTTITLLGLTSPNMLGNPPPARIALPALKTLHHQYYTVSPFFEVPLLEELHWSCASFTATPSDGDVNFPSLKKLQIWRPFPYHDEGPPRKKLDFPQLTELVLGNAVEPSTALRALLLPNTLDPNMNSPNRATPVALPYPALQSVVLKRTGEEDLDVLYGVLAAVLELYPNVKLTYDPHQTFPNGDEEFWGRIRTAFCARVLRGDG